VATISRLLKIQGLFCKRVSEKRRYSAKEMYNFKAPTNRSRPIVRFSDSFAGIGVFFLFWVAHTQINYWGILSYSSWVLCGSNAQQPCKTLQLCSTLQCTATHCHILHCSSWVLCGSNTVQHCKILQLCKHTKMQCNTLRYSPL